MKITTKLIEETKESHNSHAEMVATVSEATELNMAVVSGLKRCL